MAATTGATIGGMGIAGGRSGFYCGSSAGERDRCLILAGIAAAVWES